MSPRIVWTHSCNQPCDWRYDPNARAGLETQAERHMKETGHSVTSHGVPEETTKNEEGTKA